MGQLLAIKSEGLSFWKCYKLERKETKKSLEMNEKMSSLKSFIFENKELMQSAGCQIWPSFPASPMSTTVAHHFGLPLVFNVRWTSRSEGHFDTAPSPLSYVLLTGTELSYKISFSWKDFKCNLILYMEKSNSRVCLTKLCWYHRKILWSRHRLQIQAADLWLIVVDFVFEFPCPTMPNVIYMGGFQCKPS